MRLFVLLAVAGLVVVDAGVGLWSFPSALILAGLETLAAAYGGAYWQARTKGSKGVGR